MRKFDIKEKEMRARIEERLGFMGVGIHDFIYTDEFLWLVDSGIKGIQ